MSIVSVAVVDDQELVRAGFIALLTAAEDIEVVGQASNGEEAVRMVRATHPDIVMMDIRMPVLNGIEATRQIAADPQCAGTHVVVLTTFGLDEYVFGALRAGATGFLLKDTAPDQLLHAVRSAADGDALLSPSITRRLIETFGTTQAIAKPRTGPELTQRETDVLHLVAQGMSNADIASQLHIGPATVKTYVSRLLTKLDLTSRVHLVIHAYESGLITRQSTGRRPS